MNVLNFEPKQCGQVRRQLDAYLSNELLVETTSEVLKHLEGCEACSGELESRARVREALQRAIARQLAPEHLREAIHLRLRSARPGFFEGIRATTWMVALASLALVIVAGQQGLRLWRGRQLVASVLTFGVADHIPHVVVLDGSGHAVYNDSGEVSESRISGTLDQLLRQPSD